MGTYYKYPLVQKACCNGCDLARKEHRDRLGNITIIKEKCQWGGLVAKEKGNEFKPNCYQ